MNDAKNPFDTVVIGGGPAGVAAAIAVARTGTRTALIARCAPYADNRTTALLGATVDFLARLEIWPRCADQAVPLQTMRLVDGVLDGTAGHRAGRSPFYALPFFRTEFWPETLAAAAGLAIGACIALGAVRWKTIDGRRTDRRA